VAKDCTRVGLRVCFNVDKDADATAGGGERGGGEGEGGGGKVGGVAMVL